MSSINGLGATPPIQQTQNITGQNSHPAAAKPSATDRLELSGVSHLLQTLKTNDIARIKWRRSKRKIGGWIVRCGWIETGRGGREVAGLNILSAGVIAEVEGSKLRME